MFCIVILSLHFFIIVLVGQKEKKKENKRSESTYIYLTKTFPECNTETSIFCKAVLKQCFEKCCNKSAVKIGL